MNKITYFRHGDYFIPDLTLPESNDNRDIGIYGRRHCDYLKQHRKITYINLLTSGKLHSYLADVNEQATDMLLKIMEQMKKAQGVTEELKAADQMNTFKAKSTGYQFMGIDDWLWETIDYFIDKNLS